MSTLNFFRYDFHPQTVLRRATQGAAVGLVLMIIFMYGDNVIGNKGWAFTFREYFLMITISVSGACGSVFYSFMEPLRNQGGWYKICANILCLFVFIVAL
jgi:hypothetical protein